ncbi:helix-turn-helix domain-containing protein [Streptomyces sp. NBC_01728]|uniref:ArsR/SmtB family transcription factor n=1 Tax=unclassified Streptomyces TaxID=2593676 RepID=UPI00224D8A59|nr:MULTISPECIES: helix-turn-helix domain-containing protein [unclassified Streptomyces]MCX4459386.1 helix-turn-helix domain-containing protein [Streptomyces sp. NBC_01719]MCX4498743.1 helix-turn-helix domain-containing protein [Streptomyces sp. NBC_01728]MCX4595352.1 helix-turn-helix domain-containing protein [Streptomyces sp. NBC_01549]
MLRIHFTSDDLQNIRVARQPDPLWELMCSVCRLETGQGPLEFGHWRRSARQRFSGDSNLGRALRPLRALIPATGYIPDFLTPPVTGGGLSAGLDQLLRTPRVQLVRELTRLAESRPVPNWAASLGRPGSDALKVLANSLGIYFRGLLEPHWPHIRTAVGNDVGVRARVLLDGGTQALLASLRPVARWNAPVLEVDYPVQRDLYLEGRGLLLVPSYFCWRRPTALADPGLDPVLVYPVAKAPLTVADGTDDGVERLLGRTRAAVLTEVAGQSARTTSEVAGAVGIALPSASYQIGVLRDGGLVASHRDGKYVLHTATPLGLRLLGNGPRIRESGPRPVRGAAAGPWHDRGHA